MIKRLLPLTFVLATFTFFCFGQQNKIQLDDRLEQAWSIGDDAPMEAIKIADSIKNAAVGLKLYSIELNALNAISNFYLYNRDFNACRTYARLGIAQAENYKLPFKKGIFYNTLGLAFYTQGNYQDAAQEYLKAAAFFQKSNEHRFTATAYLNLGMTYRKLSQFQKANTYYFKSAEVYTRLKDTVNLSGVYQSIGNVFDAWGRYSSALSYYRLGLHIAEQRQDKKLLAQGYNNVGYAFLQLGELDSSIVYLKKALEIRKKGNEQSKVLLLQNLAAAWRRKGQFTQAEKYLQESMRIAQTNEMKDELLRGKIDYTELFLEKKEYQKALGFSLQADSLAQKLGSDDLRLKSLLLISSAYQGMKNFKAALGIEKLANTLRAKIFSQAESKALKELEIRYQTRQRELRIASLEKEQKLGESLIKSQKRFILLMVIAATILTLVLCVCIKLYFDKRRSAKKIQVLMDELHHRVKNNLQILSSIFNIQLSQAENEQVKKHIWENEMRLNAMNLIHKQLYHNEENTLINLKTFLTDLATNVKDSFGHQGEKIKLRLRIQEIEISAEKAVALGLMVNEILTNSLKYGSLSNDLEIEIKLIQHGGFLELNISDNGRGFSTQEDTHKKSFGLKLINIMAQQLTANMEFSSNDGVSYHFVMPEAERSSKS